MPYQQSIDHCLKEHGGYGVSRTRIDALLATLALAVSALANGKDKAAAPLLALPSMTSDLAAIEALAAQIRRRFKTVVIAGFGGSGLSGRTLLGLSPFPQPAFHFLENIDPETFDPLLERLDLPSTCFIVVSKSGSTAETLAQFYILHEQVAEKLGHQAAAERFTVITLPGDNPLRQSAEKHGMTLLDHAPDIGGRFSVLTPVGLLPAAIAGLDIRALRAGAQEVVDTLRGAPADCPPAIGAALQYAFIEAGTPMTVMLPYSERLACFAAWFRQCWAESLGKEGRGSTPLRAMGATDQHSQLQLYLDGPRDKLFTLITLSRAGSGQRIPVPEREDLAYLRGKTMGDVLAAEQRATLETLVHNRCPVRLFALDKLEEKQLGALLMHVMLEIILTAGLLGVNAFDQPAVEDGKRRAREYLIKNDL
ncbi:MAG: glucose-6-phosphate isomerase [Pseudomonadota bacterium]|nr:glucose-6-phosphate isomerase [Pseudomonadota bacterium]